MESLNEKCAVCGCEPKIRTRLFYGYAKCTICGAKEFLSVFSWRKPFGPKVDKEMDLREAWHMRQEITTKLLESNGYVRVEEKERTP